MSFYIVPTMLYQQQQKAKHKKSKRSQSRRSSKSSGSIAPDSASKDTITSKSHSRASLPTSDEGSISDPNKNPKLGNFDPNCLMREEVEDTTDPGADVVTKQFELSSNEKSPGKKNPCRNDYREDSKTSDKSQSDSHLSSSSPINVKLASSKQENVVFETFESLEILNSENRILETFYKPEFVMLRFTLFLNSLCDHQVSDPINFAGVRVHSLYKFVSRLNSSLLNDLDNSLTPIKSDIHHFEGLISYELLRCRHFLRRLKGPDFQHTIRLTEELIQSNIINYIRFLLFLPKLTQSAIEGFGEFCVQHYHFKDFFADMALKLNTIRKDGYMDEVSVDVLDEDYLLQSLVKITHEFNLLESYFIHILFKLGNGFLIEQRLTKHLFNLYKLTMKLERKESLKVLIFNSIYSRQYSWYLAATLPFLRIIETSVIYEDCEGDPSEEQPDHLEDFGAIDKSLWKEFFCKLNFGSFEEFSGLSRKDLASIQRDASSNPNLMKLSADNLSVTKIKPINFEYYSKSLRTIASETFHVIQSRDLSTQLKTYNFKSIIREFHRLLKPGGRLELPLFRSGDEPNLSIPQGVKTSFPNPTTFMGIEIKESLDLIPQFFEELFRELCETFGAKNIKYASSLLSSHHNMNNYLISFTALSVYEKFGQVDKLCEQFDRLNSQEKLNESSCHYYFYIQAEKC